MSGSRSRSRFRSNRFGCWNEWLCSNEFSNRARLWIARRTEDAASILRIVADPGFAEVKISLPGVTGVRATAMAQLIPGDGLPAAHSDGLSMADGMTLQDQPAQQPGSQICKWRCGRPHLTPPAKPLRNAHSAEVLARLDGVLADSGVRPGTEAINRFETDPVNTPAKAGALAHATGSAHVDQWPVRLSRLKEPKLRDRWPRDRASRLCSGHWHWSP